MVIILPNLDALLTTETDTDDHYKKKCDEKVWLLTSQFSKHWTA